MVTVSLDVRIVNVVVVLPRFECNKVSPPKSGGVHRAGEKFHQIFVHFPSFVLHWFPAVTVVRVVFPLGVVFITKQGSWLIKFAPLCCLIRASTRANRASVDHVFARSAPATYICFKV